jgi:hypothetical protein
MGGVPIIGDVVETVTNVISPNKKRTSDTRAGEVSKESDPAPKKDITRVLRRRNPRKRVGASLVGGRLLPTPGAETGTDYSPIRNPRDSSTLGS